MGLEPAKTDPLDLIRAGALTESSSALPRKIVLMLIFTKISRAPKKKALYQCITKVLFTNLVNVG